MTTIEQRKKPHREIARLIRQMRENIVDHKSVLYIPTEWWVSECDALLLEQTADVSDFNTMLKEGSESFQKSRTDLESSLKK
jgi:hypothetical protein